jgi:hypothetical protein
MEHHHSHCSTDISHEMPDVFKIPDVGVRPQIPKERRMFPDTIDLDRQREIDPNHDDSAVSFDCPTYMQTNKFIGIRSIKPRWQVRQSQENLSLECTRGGLTEDQVKVLGKEFGLTWELRAQQYPDIVPQEQNGADHRRKRHTTKRERRVSMRKKQTQTREQNKLESTIGQTRDMLAYFDNTTLKGVQPSAAGITEIDNQSVRKKVGEPCTLFL